MVFFLDENFNKIAIIDNYDSILWNEAYNDQGDFEVFLKIGKQDDINLYKNTYYVRNEESDQIGIVETKEIKTDIENGDSLIFKGGLFNTLLKRRIVWQQTILKGTAVEAITRIINENIIAPASNFRKIDNFELKFNIKNNINIEKQVTGASVFDTVKEICTEAGYGFKLLLGEIDKKITMLVYEGQDRSKQVIFSDDYDNLANTDYFLNIQKYNNNVLIAGEGEGKDRKRVELGVNEAGISRRELYVDAKSISSNNGEISEADYLNLLKAEGIKALGEHMIEESFEGELIENYNFSYKKDYFLGDKVKIINEFGITTTATITGALLTDSINEFSITPTFSF